MGKINLKSDLIYVNTQFDNLIKKQINYYTLDETKIKLDMKANITYVDLSCQNINNKFQLYETIVGNDIKLFDVNKEIDNLNRKFLNYDIIDVATIKLDLKANITYVDSTCQTINNRFQLYETIVGADIKLSTKADKTDSYPKSEINVAIGMLQAGIDRENS